MIEYIRNEIKGIKIHCNAEWSTINQNGLLPNYVCNFQHNLPSQRMQQIHGEIKKGVIPYINAT